MEERKDKASNEKIPYESPSIVEEEELIFPEEVWKQFSDGHWCFGCTNCNCN
jgi:hypothetical protein